MSIEINSPVDLANAGDVGADLIAAGGQAVGTINDFAYKIEVTTDNADDPYIALRRDAGPGPAEAWVGVYAGTYDIAASTIASGTAMNLKVQAGSSGDGAGGNLQLVGGADNGNSNPGGNVVITPGQGSIAGILQINGATRAIGNFRIDGSVGLNSDPDAGAALDIVSTTGALILPRMTTTERNGITAVNGMLVYNTTTSKVQAYAGGSWVDLH